MTEIERILIRIGRGAPLAYRVLSAEEQAWRGRYLLMVVAVGASPTFAWANALAPDVNGSAKAIKDTVRAVLDDVLIDQCPTTNDRLGRRPGLNLVGPKAATKVEPALPIDDVAAGCGACDDPTDNFTRRWIAKPVQVRHSPATVADAR